MVNVTRISSRGRVLVVAALAACALGVTTGATATAKPLSGAVAYKGKTAKGLPVSFRVVGGTIRNFTAGAHALCISVADASSYLDSVLHLVTPPVGKLDRQGRFSLKIQKGSIYMAAGGRVIGASAGGSYEIRYSGFNGKWVTACKDAGTWKARRMSPP